MTSMDIRRLVIALVLVLALPFVAATAQEAALQKVAEKHKNVRTLTASVTRVTHRAAIDGDISAKGTLYFKGPDKMCIRFEGEKDMLLMDGDRFTMVEKGKTSVAKGQTQSQFEALRNVFTNIILGKSDEAEAEVKTVKAGNAYVITVTPAVEGGAKAKRRLMFTSFTLTIDAGTYEFKSLRMDGRGGNYTQYNLSGYTVNPDVDGAVFNLIRP